MELELLGGVVDVDPAYVAEPPAEIRRQIDEYEHGERRTFDLSTDVPTSFLGRVMDAMSAIPYGETCTYGELAAELDTAPIAVGQACGRNPVPIVVPCHRVVGSDGGMHGYSAPGGVALKRRLLDLERSAAGGD